MAAAWLRSSTDQDCLRDACADGHAGPMARTRVCPAAAVSRRGDLLAQRRLLIQPFGIAIRHLPLVQDQPLVAFAVRSTRCATRTTASAALSRTPRAVVVR